MTWLRLASCLPLLACSIAVAACGGDDSRKDSAPVKLTAPRAIADAGEIVFCSDMAYPPIEFIDKGKPAGSDVEVAKELARRLGVKATMRNTSFDKILDELNADKCDVVISSMTVTKEREKEAAFIPYATWGQSLMVPTANPRNIEGLDDLAGATVAVEVATVNEEFLDGRADEYDPPMKVRAFDDDADATSALRDGSVDAYFADSPVVAHYIGQEALTYAFAGEPVNAEPIGMAVRRSDTKLRKELERGVEAMYEDGAMKSILKRWKLADFALKR